MFNFEPSMFGFEQIPMMQQKPQKAKFTPQDDQLLKQLVTNSIIVDWAAIANQMKNRNARQCRERWQNYLDPKLTQDEWSEEDDALILQKQKELGPRWNAIARFFKGRSGNSVRNRFLMLQRHSEKKAKKAVRPISQMPVPQQPTFAFSQIQPMPQVPAVLPTVITQPTVPAPIQNQTKPQPSQEPSSPIDLDSIFCNDGSDLFNETDKEFEFLSSCFF